MNVQRADVYERHDTGAKGTCTHRRPDRDAEIVGDAIRCRGCEALGLSVRTLHPVGEAHVVLGVHVRVVGVVARDGELQRRLAGVKARWDAVVAHGTDGRTGTGDAGMDVVLSGRGLLRRENGDGSDGHVDSATRWISVGGADCRERDAAEMAQQPQRRWGRWSCWIARRAGFQSVEKLFAKGTRCCVNYNSPARY